MAEIEGYKELNRRLTALGEKVGGAALRSATGAAMTPVVQEARLRAPQGDRAHRTYKGRLVAPGFLSRSIKKSTYLSKDKTYAYSSVGMAKEAYYGWLLEKGTKHITKRPWLAPAFQSRESQVKQRFVDWLEKRIEAARKVK